MELRKHIRKILAETFFDPDKVFTGKQVNQHIKNITPDSSDLPDFFMNNIIAFENFKLKEISLEDLLKSDPSFKEYYKGGEERYDQDEMDPSEIYQELVVVNGQLLDGYNRASTLLRRGEKTAEAYVSL